MDFAAERYWPAAAQITGVLRDDTADRQADGGAHAAARGGNAGGRGAGKPDQENLEPAVDSGAGRP
jgi:hypothetical protein